MTTPPLNGSQTAFCEAPIGNIRLLAPAGCGKTLSILHRCLHLAHSAKGGRPRFLIVAFTRAARDELQFRLNKDDQFEMLKDTTDIATLNSWGFRRIKTAAFSPRLITTKDEYHFTVLNQLQPIWQQYRCIKDAIENRRNYTPRVLMDVTDAFKSLGFDHQRHTNYKLFSYHLDYLEDQNLAWRMEEQFNELARLGVLTTELTAGGSEVPTASREEVYEAFFQFWCAASGHLISNATFTLEDQKYFAYLDERQKVEERSFLSGATRYSHVFVDEFQDINPLDLSLVKAIMQRNRATLTVAGDDDQAIFEWRGATSEYILDPGKFFEAEFNTHVLDLNYRAPVNIVAHSKCLIENNTRRVRKQMNALSQARSASVEVKVTSNLAGALNYVCNVIQDSITQGTSPTKFAIIGRKRSQIIPYQVHFAAKEISFCAAEDLSVFLSKTFTCFLDLIEIKIGALSRQRPSQVADDVLQLCDLVKRYPLNNKDKNKLHKYIKESRPTSVEAAIDVLAGYRDNLKGRNANGQMSVAMAEAIRKFVAAETVGNTLLTLGTEFKGLQTDLGKAEDDIFYTDPPFFQLAEFASSYEDNYKKFVYDIERAKEQLIYTPPFDEEQSQSANELWQRPVHLMTALRAKGKEFDTVVLLDTVDGIWPNKNANTLAQLEAERRVFYVAFTRARERIVMLISAFTGGKESIPSPYIGELSLPTGSLVQ